MKSHFAAASASAGVLYSPRAIIPATYPERLKKGVVEWRYGPLPNALDRVSLTASQHRRMKGKGMLSSVQNSGTLSVSTIRRGLDDHWQRNVEGRNPTLVLGENSSVKGDVAANDVVIRGRLIGSIKALGVMLQSTSHVEGDITHKSLAIEQGAFFDGRSLPLKNGLSTSQITVEDSTATGPVVEKRKEKRENSLYTISTGIRLTFDQMWLRRREGCLRQSSKERSSPKG